MPFKIYGHDKTTHRIEKQVYDAFLKSASSLEKYFAFGIANWTRYGNEMESDLILVGKAGIFVIEIKGGRLDVRDGLYHQNGKPMNKSPLKQASDNYWNIIRILNDNGLSKYKDVGGGYVCLFPETTWDYSADTVNSQLILDYAYSQNLPQNMSRIISWYKEENTSKGLHSSSISQETIEKIKSILIGNTKKVSDVRHVINLNRQKLVELSKEQYESYIEISENKRIIINGPPGSGKTLLAFQILKDSEQGGVRTLFICKNKALAVHLKHKMIDELGNEPKFVTIKNIDQIASENADSSIDYKDFHKIIESATQQIAAGYKGFTSFEYLLIDEAQDLMKDDYIALIDVIVEGGIEGGRWCMFIDFHQNLLNHSRPADGEELYQIYFAEYATIKKLTKNYRNTDIIQRTASTLSHTEPVRTNGLTGESPEIKIFHDQEDEARTISHDINTLIDNGVKPSEITVLSFVGRDRSVAGRGLIKLKYGVKMQHINDLDFSKKLSADNLVTYASLYEYKGLDNDVILLTDINDIDGNDVSAALHLVGATRARNQYTMYVTKDVMSRLLDPNKGNLLYQIDPEYVN